MTTCTGGHIFIHQPISRLPIQRQLVIGGDQSLLDSHAVGQMVGTGKMNFCFTFMRRKKHTEK